VSLEATHHRPRQRQQIWIVLPAYNEAESLPPLLARIEETLADSGLEGQVVLVDDGSQDGTGELAAEAALRLPMVILTHEVNQGLGATIRDGLTKACELAAPEDVIVSLDADNSHPPELIPRIVSVVREG
jgi:dolichol-phosphate mannosyltransferase